ncbi:MAG: ATP-binding cassette domain-containing protein [Pseudomonadota bacterium]
MAVVRWMDVFGIVERGAWITGAVGAPFTLPGGLAALSRTRPTATALAAATVLAAFLIAPETIAPICMAAALAALPLLGMLVALAAAILAPSGLATLAEAVGRAASHPALHLPLRRQGATPVSQMRGFWGLVTAYWTSERWVEAWLITAAVIGLTTLLSKASVWVAMASADFLNALVNVHAASAGADPVAWVLGAAGIYAAIALGRIGGVALRHFASSTLHRRARRWIQAQYQAAMLGAGHIPANLVSDRDEGPDARLPDNIDQRVDECSMSVFGAIIGLAMGLWGAIASIYFVSAALLERSAPVGFLEDWGAAASAFIAQHTGLSVDLAPGALGSFVLVVVLVVTYVPLMTWAAWRLGRVLERQTIARQKADGSWRGELGQMLSRAPRLAISRGESVQARVNARLYGSVDVTWHRLNGTQSGFMAFTNGYNFITNRLLGYLPGLPAYLSGAISFKTYAASSELVAELINDSSWFIQVMPALATLKANTARLTELAQAIEAAGDNARFYADTGRHDFKIRTADAGFGLRLRGLELCHRGHGEAPFLTVPGLTIRPGRWAYVRGQNGAGKSCLLKAVMGLWPYGGGEVIRPTRAFFAGQDADLPPRLTLKELVTYPDLAECHDDLAIAAVLGEVGLARFVPDLHEPLCGAKPWGETLSGGQRQRLVLARILLQRPDLLLLDEACSALDPLAMLDFHRILRGYLPRATVVSVMHEPEPPLTPEGAPYYADLLVIENGRARLEPAPGSVRLGIAAE